MRHEMHEPNRSESSSAQLLRALGNARYRESVPDAPVTRVLADVMAPARPAPAPAPVTEALASSPVRANNLLRLLQLASRTEYEWLLPLLEPVTLERGEVLFEAGGPVSCVYLHETSVTSHVRVLSDGKRLEVGMSGPEGLAGLPAFFGADRAPLQCIVKVGGTAQRLSARALREATPLGSALHGILERYAQYMFDHTAQAAACSSLHGVDERCASWLLMTHDRVQGDQFELTHGFLASMLGVRRASVSQAAEAMQRAGMIRYSRGRMSIADRTALEGAACECYGADRADFERLFHAERPVALVAERADRR